MALPLTLRDWQVTGAQPSEREALRRASVTMAFLAGLVDQGARHDSVAGEGSVVSESCGSGPR